MSTDDGGPAFPYSALTPEGPQMYADARGMSLRDYFAGQALNGIFASGGQVSIAGEIRKTQHAYEMGLSDRTIAMETNKAIATMTYEIADAMLAQRQKDVLE